MSRDFPKQNQPINNFTKYFPCFPFTAGSLKSNRKFQVYKGEKTKVKEYENLSYLCAFWREARDGFVSFARGRNFHDFYLLIVDEPFYFSRWIGRRRCTVSCDVISRKIWTGIYSFYFGFFSWQTYQIFKEKFGIKMGFFKKSVILNLFLWFYYLILSC